MGIRTDGTRVFFCPLSIDLSEYPDLLMRFMAEDPDTQRIELLGRELIEEGVAEEALKVFIRAVCKWGGYPGVSGNIFKNNDTSFLLVAFRAAIKALELADPVSALRHLISVRNLGISFGSKHLKFLAPDQVVVLDSIISRRLGYPIDDADLSGFASFLDDCRRIRDLLRTSRVPYPGWGSDGWRISDVEMAIFQALREDMSIAPSTT